MHKKCNCCDFAEVKLTVEKSGIAAEKTQIVSIGFGGTISMAEIPRYI